MLYLLSASLIWAFSYGLIKVNLTSLDPNFVTFCRMLSALPFFLPFLRFKSLTLKAALLLFLIGAIQYGLMYLFFIRAFQYLEAHQAALYTAMTPLYVILIGNSLSRKFTFFYGIMACLAVLGGMIIYWHSAEDNNIQGFMLVQMADICFAYGQVAYKKFKESHTHLKDREIYGFLFLGAISIAAISTTALGGWRSLEVITVRQAWILFYLGSVASGLAFFWWNKGALKVNLGTLAVFNNLKAPLAILVSICFFGEKTHFLTLLIGLGLVGMALLLTERYGAKQPSF